MVTGIILDKSKALECLGHELILTKLEQFGLNDRQKHDLQVT